MCLLPTQGGERYCEECRATLAPLAPAATVAQPQPNAYCYNCKAPVVTGARECPTCLVVNPATLAAPVVTKSTNSAAKNPNPLLGFGVVACVVGLYYLVLAPNAPGTDVVNLQRLAIGMTATVTGVVLIAAGTLRRRSGN